MSPRRKPYPAAIWSKDQLEFLKSNYAEMDTVKIVVKIGKPIWRIYAKAKELGLRKKKHTLVLHKDPNEINDPSPLDIAYLAGIIDADGHISIQKSIDRKYPVVTAGNTNFQLMEWLVNTFGYSVYVQKVRAEPHYKPYYRWRVPQQYQIKILTAILPHLIVKRVAAETVLSFLRK